MIRSTYLARFKFNTNLLIDAFCILIFTDISNIQPIYIEQHPSKEKAALVS